MGVATGVDATSVGAAVGDEDDDGAVGVGVGELVEGRVTGQVETFVVVGDDCAGGGCGFAPWSEHMLPDRERSM